MQEIGNGPNIKKSFLEGGIAMPSHGSRDTSDSVGVKKIEVNSSDVTISRLLRVPISILIWVWQYQSLGIGIPLLDE